MNKWLCTCGLLLLLGMTSVAAENSKKLVPELVGVVDDWMPQEVSVKGATQGFAIYGKYGFVFHDKGQCVVVDIKKKKYVSTFQLQDNATHCNNACFGLEKADKNSKFPVLYISECKGQHACYVTDIALNGSRTVQKIFYDGSEFMGSFDWFVDRKNHYLYAFGGIGNKVKRAIRFKLPKISDKDAQGELHLKETDVLARFDIPNINIYQGSLVYGDCFYLPDGYAPHDRLLHVYNWKKAEKVQTLNLNDLIHEPEGLDVSGKWLYVVFHVAKQPRRSTLYRFALK